MGTAVTLPVELVELALAVAAVGARVAVVEYIASVIEWITEELIPVGNGISDTTVPRIDNPLATVLSSNVSSVILLAALVVTTKTYSPSGISSMTKY